MTSQHQVLSRAADPNEAKRLAALRRYDILDTPPEEAFDRIADLATVIFDVPIALVSLVDEERQWFKACYGLDVRETSRDVSFCAYAMYADEVMVVPDATQDPRFQDNPLVTGELGIRFYAGAPLKTPDGHGLGSLCIIDTKPHAVFTTHQQQILTGLAAQVIAELELRLTAERLRQERDLSERLKTKFDRFFSVSVDLFCIVEAAGTFVQVNPAWEKLLGFSAEELTGRPFIDFVHPDDLEVTLQAMQHLPENGTVFGLENRYRTKDGSYRWLRWSAQVSPEDRHAYAVAHDITERRWEQAELERVSRQRANILESISDIFFSLDTEWRFSYLNSQAEQFLGQSRDALLHKTLKEAFPGVENYPFYETCREAVATWQPVTFEFHSSVEKWFEVNLYPASDGLSVYLKDISARKQTEAVQQEMQQELERLVAERTAELSRLNEQLQHDAFHDALTGLANRALFLDRLEQVMRRQRQRPSGGYAVLFMDFDRFKLVNDSLGHGVGDALLKALGKRLLDCVRPGDTVARLGGDEFTILLETVDSLEETTRTAERIQHELAKPFDIAGHRLHSSASMGIVTGEVGHTSADDVLRDADLAMYRAKALGKARYQVFTPEMRERAVSLLSLENDLRQALGRGELRVFYQPIVSIASEKITGFEALVRWEHPNHGLVSPAEFIPIAEETGLIIDLDRWVLREACRQVKAWQIDFQTNLTVSVNLSGQQFNDANLVEVVQTVLSETAFEPGRLKLEITESTLMQHANITIDILKKLKATGVQVYIDDFGTGYSSLNYLQRFPVNTLKIDRAFVNQMLQSPESDALIETIITMAEKLNLNVVAEGIETEAQLQRLKTLGCGLGQGYLFAKPLRADEVPGYLMGHSVGCEVVTRSQGFLETSA